MCVIPQYLIVSVDVIIAREEVIYLLESGLFIAQIQLMLLILHFLEDEAYLRPTDVNDAYKYAASIFFVTIGFVDWFDHQNEANAK